MIVVLSANDAVRSASTAKGTRRSYRGSILLTVFIRLRNLLGILTRQSALPKAPERRCQILLPADGRFTRVDTPKIRAVFNVVDTILTDRERLDMVREMSRDFLHGDHGKNVDRAIQTIDHLAEGLSFSPQPRRKIGPFSFFPLGSFEPEDLGDGGLFDAPGYASTSEVLSTESQPSPGAMFGGPNPMDPDEHCDVLETVMPWLDGVGDVTLSWADATNIELWPILPSPLLQPCPGSVSDQQRGQYLEQKEVNVDSLSAAPCFNHPLPETFSPDGNVQGLDPTLAVTAERPHLSDRNYLDPIPRSLSNMKNISKIPSESRYLLEHYFTQVVDYMCHFPNPQSPWRTIYFPCAMSTMADLLVFGGTNHARMALFYALLSVSANHLNSKVSPSMSLSRNVASSFESAGLAAGTYWLTKGSLFQRMAAAQIHTCLQSQPVGLTNSEVYEELLMSLLSMVTISVTSGELESADTYLQHAEQTIDSNSSAVSQSAAYRSSKMATLHQIYSYLHVIYTSTQVSLPSQEGAIPLRESGSPVILGPVAPPPGPLSRVVWPQEIDDSQFFPRTYGVPRSLLALISKASAAAREIESRVGTHGGVPLPPRWQHLEDEICNWQVSPQEDELPSQSQNQSQPPYNPQIKSHLVRAMHDALLVMFFRRIRRINRIVVQHYVESAADHLNAQEAAKVQAGINAPALLWPWFMVATEAVGAAVRRKLSQWATVARRYGGRNLDVAEQVVNEVWRRQDQQLPNQSWADVVREWHVTLVLT